MNSFYYNVTNKFNRSKDFYPLKSIKYARKTKNVKINFTTSSYALLNEQLHFAIFNEISGQV